jgi:hypothetical protein
LFTWIILSPFLSREKLTAIFGKDLMADTSLQPILEELNGTAPVKPFECVGTLSEVNEAIRRILPTQGDKFLLKRYRQLKK